MKKVEPDCQTCGACCGPLHDQEVFVDVTAKDIARLSRHYRERNLHLAGMWVLTGDRDALITKHNHNGTVCVALRGSIGKRVSCTIYEKRPEACRSFKPGSRVCLEVRREVLGAA